VRAEADVVAGEHAIEAAAAFGVALEGVIDDGEAEDDRVEQDRGEDDLLTALPSLCGCRGSRQFGSEGGGIQGVSDLRVKCLLFLADRR